ncbi:hypothetical protein HanXRQr2_Chr12g0541621 [Helianthus annuus]|uniref:Uncharacterized protein n=1 Tax=Helianthus annuus TaxID=4232 RepID=A0A9K3MW01_HELAN|nr:hypothetical protein HanXRQr2_Chr12g0541621 [Helianthus annuus]KAJ0862707.1 hypothetical protein HanPSC8_Chr12g0521441 [Helianthus annuus]
MQEHVSPNSTRLDTSTKAQWTALLKASEFISLSIWEKYSRNGFKAVESFQPKVRSPKYATKKQSFL